VFDRKGNNMSYRVYMNSFDDWGCGHYRAKMPVYQCYSDLNKDGIYLHLEKELHSDESYYDAYILHRMPVENSIFFAQDVQKKGAKFILELDDDIFNIPEWMPSDEFKNSKWSLKKGLDMADEIWVATETLAKSIDRLDKTHVLPNLIDFHAFLAPVPPAMNPIRILWMGSVWHDKDLEQLVAPVLRIVEEYGEKVQFLFWGCLPTAFADYQRVPGQNLAVLTQKDFNFRIIYLDGLPFKLYFDRLVKIGAYIGLAPLYDCKFNDSKSNIKYLEYTMAGAPTIATNLDPYNCIKDGHDGLLVEPHDEEGWYQAIKKLIDDKELHDTLVANARKKAFEKYSWQSQGKKQLWIDAFKRIAGK
jgi:glycosyltransferase involved in cell wall biosynthesis